MTFTTSNDKLIITGSNPTSVVHQTTGGVNETLNVPEGESVSTMATGGMYVNFFRGAKGVGEADYFIIMSDGDMSLSANIYQLYSYSTNTTWPSERVFVDFGRDVVSMDMQSGEFVFYHNTQNGQIQTGGGYSLAVNEGASSLSSYSDSFTQLVRTGNNTFVVVQTGSVSNTSDIYP
ncbi:MAG: hypothetical protein HZB29_04630 [Nitrospinae bacterium]|nr:hypothetical protein [Nitrospinota bacterium]